jgi:hypothetical protein
MKPVLLRSISIAACLIPILTNAQVFQVGAWNTLEGKLGNSDMQMALYLFRDGSLKGNYILKYTGTKTQLAGTQIGKAVTLKEVIKNTPWGTFKGTVGDSADKFSGSWTDSGATQMLAFNLRLLASNLTSYEMRYPGLFGTQEDIEQFVKKAVAAILINDKDWLGDHIRFPLRHIAGKGFNGIADKQAMIRHYDEIFTRQFKDKIRQAYTTNLFTRNSEVMLGTGEIWFGNVSGSTKDKYSYQIVSVNP